MFQDARTRIQQQEAAADQLLAQMNAPQEQPAPIAEDPEAQVAPVEPPAAATEQPQAPAPAPVQPATAPAVDWEHKYKTLQGIHNSHTAELKERLRRREAELQAALAAKPEPTKPEVPELDTKKDAEVFGEDLVQMVVRIVDSKFGHLVNSFNDRLKVIEDRYQATTETVAKTAQDLFLDRVRSRVSDLDEVNVDPLFLEWLAEADPIYGHTRQAVLDHAANSLDADRVIAIFTAFKATKAPAPAPVAPPAQQQLERQVAPRTTAAAAVPDTPRFFTEQEVAQFYADVRRGLYRGQEAKAAQIEAEFDKALSEGRIR